MKVLVLVFLMVGRIIISDCNVYSFGFGVYNVDGGLKYNRIGLYGLVVRRGKVCEFRISFGFCNNMRLMLLFMFGVWFYVQMDYMLGLGFYNVGVGIFKVGFLYFIVLCEYRFYGQKFFNFGFGVYNVFGVFFVGWVVFFYIIVYKY